MWNLGHSIHQSIKSINEIIPSLNHFINQIHQSNQPIHHAIIQSINQSNELSWALLGSPGLYQTVAVIGAVGGGAKQVLFFRCFCSGGNRGQQSAVATFLAQALTPGRPWKAACRSCPARGAGFGPRALCGGARRSEPRSQETATAGAAVAAASACCSLTGPGLRGGTFTQTPQIRAVGGG